MTRSERAELEALRELLTTLVYWRLKGGTAADVQWEKARRLVGLDLDGNPVRRVHRSGRADDGETGKARSELIRLKEENLRLTRPPDSSAPPLGPVRKVH